MTDLANIQVNEDRVGDDKTQHRVVLSGLQMAGQTVKQGIEGCLEMVQGLDTRHDVIHSWDHLYSTEFALQTGWFNKR